jgi:LysM repeat protein
MKQIRVSPWLILVLAAVLVLAVGCDRPDPQVAIDTPQPMNVTPPVVAPQEVATAVPGGESTLPPESAATPTLPPPMLPTTEGAAAEQTPVPVQPTPEAPAQPTPQAQPTAEAVTAQGNILHTVKLGETLFSIGRLYNVNPYAIAAANNIPYPYVIYPGQQLTIPTGGTTPPGPTPPPPSGQCRYSHTVRPGENLYRISLAYGVPMATIAAANGIVNYNLIYAGQTLCIP